jgi:hypothetical protein
MPELDQPLYSQPIQGVRTWEVIQSERDGPLLRAWAVGQVWPPGEAMRATCVASNRFGRRRHLRELRPHLAPEPRCSCGIYALHPSHLGTRRDLLEKLDRCETEGVIGVIDAWGRAEVHGEGFRSEWARPAKLFVCGARGEAPAERIKELAEAYGAEVVALGGGRELAHEVARAEGLSRGAVRELLADEVELVLRGCAEETGFRNWDASGFEVAPGAGRASLENLEFVRFRVAGAARTPALQSEAFNLCREVLIVPTPADSREPAAGVRYAVWDRDGVEQLGWVPMRVAAQMRRLLERSRIQRALVVGHHRNRDTGSRVGVVVLATPHRRISIELPGRTRRRIPVEPDEEIF